MVKPSPSGAQQPQLTLQEQLDITTAYAQALERAQKRCQLEKADIWVQARTFEKQLALVRAELQPFLDYKVSIRDKESAHATEK